MMALVLAEHANIHCDMLRSVKMLLIHDIVEIDAGDTFIYDEKANEGKGERERMAAMRIFNILPDDQAEIYWTCGGSSRKERPRNPFSRTRWTGWSRSYKTTIQKGRPGRHMTSSRRKSLKRTAV